jgi:hypothetical protein
MKRKSWCDLGIDLANAFSYEIRIFAFLEPEGWLGLVEIKLWGELANPDPDIIALCAPLECPPSRYHLFAGFVETFCDVWTDV